MQPVKYFGDCVLSKNAGNARSSGSHGNVYCGGGEDILADAADEALIADQLVWLTAALKMLTPRQLQAVDLHVLQNLDYRTAALRMNVSEGAVRVHVHGALQRLRAGARRADSS